MSRSHFSLLHRAQGRLTTLTYIPPIDYKFHPPDPWNAWKPATTSTSSSRPSAATSRRPSCRSRSTSSTSSCRAGDNWRPYDTSLKTTTCRCRRLWRLLRRSNSTISWCRLGPISLEGLVSGLVCCVLWTLWRHTYGVGVVIVFDTVPFWEPVCEKICLEVPWKRVLCVYKSVCPDR